MKMLRKEIREWFRAFLRAVPGHTGERMRSLLYGYSAGKDSRVLTHVMIYYPENLTIGRNSAITAYCQLNAGGGLVIGNDVLIGPGTYIWSQNHRFQDAGNLIREQGSERVAVTIEDDVWIAARCVILPGVRIATGTVVAAGAVVTRSTEPYTIVAGVPAKMIGLRESSMVTRTEE